jgi:hypothetical protein
MGDKSPKSTTKAKKQKADRKSAKSPSGQQVAPGEAKGT